MSFILVSHLQHKVGLGRVDWFLPRLFRHENLNFNMQGKQKWLFIFFHFNSSSFQGSLKANLIQCPITKNKHFPSSTERLPFYRNCFSSYLSKNPYSQLLSSLSVAISSDRLEISWAETPLTWPRSRDGGLEHLFKKQNILRRLTTHRGVGHAGTLPFLVFFILPRGRC